MKKLVVFTGAGISAESGLQTFRGDGGLWEGYKVQDVATPEAWNKNPELVQRFYNERRKKCLEVEPNLAHKILAELEEYYDVNIITQNIDDLHARAGSSKVLHLHGQIRKSQSSVNPKLVYTINGHQLEMGDLCERGSQLRPHIVWFGEAVPMMEPAIRLASQADIFVVIGTSLQVYPAASLVHYIPKDCALYVIDPNADNFSVPLNAHIISSSATEGMQLLKKKLTE